MKFKTDEKKRGEGSETALMLAAKAGGGGRGLAEKK